MTTLIYEKCLHCGCYLHMIGSMQSQLRCNWLQYTPKRLAICVFCEISCPAQTFSTGTLPYILVHYFIQFECILPKGPYLPCVSMAGRVLLAGYRRFIMATRYESGLVLLVVMVPNKYGLKFLLFYKCIYSYENYWICHGLLPFSMGSCYI